MNEANMLNVDNETLIQAWNSTLPEFIKPSGECSIQADDKYSNAFLVNIADDGRSHYSFDFRVRYVDDREVDVQFLDVQKGNIHVDEQTDIIQSTVKEYVRDIHECAQSLKGLTKQ